MMKFREHRLPVENSAETIVELPRDRGALIEHLKALLAPWPSAPPVTRETVVVEPYYPETADNRPEFFLDYLVSLKDYGVMGYTDSPC